MLKTLESVIFFAIFDASAAFRGHSGFWPNLTIQKLPLDRHTLNYFCECLSFFFHDAALSRVCFGENVMSIICLPIPSAIFMNWCIKNAKRVLHVSVILLNFCAMIYVNWLELKFFSPVIVLCAAF